MILPLPNELIEHIYTFYNPHKDNYTKFLKDLMFKFTDHKLNGEIMNQKKMLYEYELKISAFGFNIMGSDILKCIFFKRKLIEKDRWYKLGLIKYWYFLFNEETNYWSWKLSYYINYLFYQYQNSIQGLKKIDLNSPVLNRLDFYE